MVKRGNWGKADADGKGKGAEKPIGDKAVGATAAQNLEESPGAIPPESRLLELLGLILTGTWHLSLKEYHWPIHAFALPDGDFEENISRKCSARFSGCPFVANLVR
jgi:hypothetical protein